MSIIGEHYEEVVIPRLQKEWEQKGFKLMFEAIKNDPDLYIAWKANIAMAFKDEYWNYFKLEGKTQYREVEDIHKVANQAADNFLQLLIK